MGIVSRYSRICMKLLFLSIFYARILAYNISYVKLDHNKSNKCILYKFILCIVQDIFDNTYLDSR